MYIYIYMYVYYLFFCMESKTLGQNEYHSTFVILTH